MSLSNEDTLRLNVLLANNIDAIRIDESRMAVHGLTGEDEARVQLHPNCRAEQYARQVRAFLSSHVLGSPGGYPVYLKRWTRMGQAKDESLADLLMLGEPEAVVAVACAPGLTDELARRVWWIGQDAENARRMLENKNIINGAMGKILAEFLVEFLPFETEPDTILRSVRLVLEPGLIDQDARMQIWNKGASKNVYRIGFLETVPDDLPEKKPAHAGYASKRDLLIPLVKNENAMAILLNRILNGSGQSFIHASYNILKRPTSQEAVSALLNAIGKYFSVGSSGGISSGTSENMLSRDINEVIDIARTQCEFPPEPLAELISTMPDLQQEISAMCVLAQVNSELVVPVFSRSTAMGSLMRKQIAPVISPVLEQLATLQSGNRAWP